jgi:hypothetical protein
VVAIVGVALFVAIVSCGQENFVSQIISKSCPASNIINCSIVGSRGTTRPKKTSNIRSSNASYSRGNSSSGSNDAVLAPPQVLLPLEQ